MAYQQSPDPLTVAPEAKRGAGERRRTYRSHTTVQQAQTTIMETSLRQFPHATWGQRTPEKGPFQKWRRPPAMVTPDGAASTPYGAAQPGDRIMVWWGGDERWFQGTVGGRAHGGRKVTVLYDDGDSVDHDLRRETWQPLQEQKRRAQEPWPRSEDEAIAREWKGYPLTAERGCLQIYARDGMDGVGVRVAPQSTALKCDGKHRALLWFDGEVHGARPPACGGLALPNRMLTDAHGRIPCCVPAGADAERRANEMMKSMTERAPEPIKVSERLFMSPRRCAAQLVECSADEPSANCVLMFLGRGRHKQWPALVQRRQIERGEAVTFWYSAEPDNILYQMALAWSVHAGRMRKDAVRVQRARKRAKVVNGQRPNGQFKCVGKPGAERGRFAKK